MKLMKGLAAGMLAVIAVGVVITACRQGREQGCENKKTA